MTLVQLDAIANINYKFVEYIVALWHQT